MHINSAKTEVLEGNDLLEAALAIEHSAVDSALDSNKDGFLTKDELTGSPALVHNFKDIDKNGDGKLSMDEWKSYGKNKNMHMQKKP